MGIPILIVGHSGSGKSTSLRNFRSGEITHINVMGKPLPFKGRFTNTVNSDKYDVISDALGGMKTKIAVIDDAQYLMANEFMRRAMERGYDKFTEIANNFWTLVNYVITELPFDVTVYFLMHIDRDDAGNEKVKTIGKLLDEKITVEGMFTIVLKSIVKDGVYSFTTQSNGHDTVKSPLGMFPTYEIENDLKAVDNIVRAFWELDIPFECSDEIAAAHDKELDENGGQIPTDAPAAPTTGRRGRKAETADATPAAGRRSRRTETPAEEIAAEPVTDNTEEVTPRRGRRRREADAPAEAPADDSVTGAEKTPAEDAPKTYTRRRRG